MHFWRECPAIGGWCETISLSWLGDGGTTICMAPWKVDELFIKADSKFAIGVVYLSGCHLTKNVTTMYYDKLENSWWNAYWFVHCCFWCVQNFRIYNMVEGKKKNLSLRGRSYLSKMESRDSPLTVWCFIREHWIASMAKSDKWRGQCACRCFESERLTIHWVHRGQLGLGNFDLRGIAWKVRRTRQWLDILV